MANLSDLKKDVFYRLMDEAGRVFVLVRHSESVIIGNRGFVGEEQKNGIVFVFNGRMNFSWDEEGINATLAFGGNQEKCFIPANDILAVYSPDLKVQLVMLPEDKSDVEGGTDVRTEAEADDSSNVIKVDFSKKVT